MKYSVRPVSIDIQGHTYQWHLNFDAVIDFHYSRQWLNETYDWGYSIEPKAGNYGAGLIVIKQHNPRWCWETQYMIYDIYLASDQELSWFKLKWGDHVAV